MNETVVRPWPSGLKYAKKYTTEVGPSWPLSAELVFSWSSLDTVGRATRTGRSVDAGGRKMSSEASLVGNDVIRRGSWCLDLPSGKGSSGYIAVARRSPGSGGSWGHPAVLQLASTTPLHLGRWKMVLVVCRFVAKGRQWTVQAPTNLSSVVFVLPSAARHQLSFPPCTRSVHHWVARATSVTHPSGK